MKQDKKEKKEDENQKLRENVKYDPFDIGPKDTKGDLQYNSPKNAFRILGVFDQKFKEGMVPIFISLDRLEVIKYFKERHTGMFSKHEERFNVYYTDQVREACKKCKKVEPIITRIKRLISNIKNRNKYV